MKARYIAALIFSATAGYLAHGATIFYADWSSQSLGDFGSAAGTIILPDSTVVSVSYTGDVELPTQVSGGINYWNPATPYRNDIVSNIPSSTDIVALAGGTQRINKITFSQQVKDPIMLIVSLGAGSQGLAVTYDFDTPFKILSSGTGFWGEGPLTQTGLRLRGIEGHGAIQFLGTVDSISWTSSYEYWHGFTVGLLPVPQVAVLPPAVAIICPANGTLFAPGANIPITAEASDPDGEVKEVRFYENGVRIDPIVTERPFSLVWSNAPAGNYVLTAKAVDNERLMATSAPVNITVTAPEPCRPAGLVSWWRGEDNARDSAGNNHGRPIGAVSYVNGRIGRAFSFDGSTYIEVSNAPDLNFGATRQMTIEFWAYRTGSGSTMHFLGKRVSCGTDNHYQVAFDPDGGLHLGIRGARVATRAQMPMRTWTHLAATVNGNEFKFFINGKLSGTQTTSMGPANTVPMRIARSGDCGGNFVGYIDEVAIYNRTLSELEIEAIYLFGLKGVSRDAVPEITAQPQNQSVNAGTTVVMKAAARSVDVLSYQWLHDGIPIPGATSDTLKLSNVALTNAGAYSLRISNCAGSVTTAPAHLTVAQINQPPTAHIVTPTNGAAFFHDANVTITAEARDPDGTVERLRFYTNGVAFVTLTNPPPTASVVWSNTPAGNHILRRLCKIT